MKRYDADSYACMTESVDGHYILYSAIAPVIEPITDERQQVMTDAESLYMSEEIKGNPHSFTRAFEWAVRKLLEGK